MSEDTATIGHNNPPKVKQKRTRPKPTSEHYVNNKEFTKALDIYARNCKEKIAKGDKKPTMNKYLGQCVIKMATRLSLSPNFRGYVYREEMIQDAILGAVNYMHLFNGDRFNNGFAYVTQILFSHMVQTIKKEKKKYELNLKLIQKAELTHMNDPEFTSQANTDAQAIADQKLGDIEEGRKNLPKRSTGFRLKTGWNKSERESYKGTPLSEAEPKDN